SAPGHRGRHRLAHRARGRRRGRNGFERQYLLADPHGCELLHDPRRRSVARGDLFNKDHTRWLHHDSTVGEGGNGIHHHVPGALACTTGIVHVDPVLELDLVGGGKPVRVKTAGGAYHLTGTQRTNRGEDDGRGPVLAR